MQTSSRRALQTFPRVPVVALSQPLMQPLPPHLTDPPTSLQPRLNHQPIPLPRHQLLSRRHLRLLPLRNPRRPSHRLHSRPSPQFGSLAILLLLRLSQRPMLLLPRREAAHREPVPSALLMRFAENLLSQSQLVLDRPPDQLKSLRISPRQLPPQQQDKTRSLPSLQSLSLNLLWPTVLKRVLLHPPQSLHLDHQLHRPPAHLKRLRVNLLLLLKGPMMVSLHV